MHKSEVQGVMQRDSLTASRKLFSRPSGSGGCSRLRDMPEALRRYATALSFSLTFVFNLSRSQKYSP